MRNRICGAALLVWWIAPTAALGVTVDWVQIDANPVNAPDTATNCGAAGCGSVSYDYFLSKYEITNAQYAEFLNEKAAADPLELYHQAMSTNEVGGILRAGDPGGYTYSVKPGFASKPVVYVSFYDALRFCNWLHNGQGSGDTETGAYTLFDGTAIPGNGTTVTRDAGARIALPSENEWYKAAYYDAISASYFGYPSRSHAMTTCAAPTSAPNSANCDGAGGEDVGAYPGSASPYGTFDQGGNVWEWNEQIIDVLRGVRGGGWFGTAGGLAATFWHGGLPAEHFPYLGFRVVSLVPEPDATTAAMLAMATLLGLGRRTRAEQLGHSR